MVNDEPKSFGTVVTPGSKGLHWGWMGVLAAVLAMAPVGYYAAPIFGIFYGIDPVLLRRVGGGVWLPLCVMLGCTSARIFE